MLSEYGEVLENASLKKYNTYGIDTYSKYLIKVLNIEKLVDLIGYLNEKNIKYMVLGKGSNVILPDNSFDGAIISLEKLNKVEIKDNLVYAEAGITLSLLAKKVIDDGLSGFEYLAGIPGSLGGALFGNAGIKDHEIYDNVKDITIIRENKLIKIDKKDIKYSYRNTEFKENKDIIVSATFKLSKGDKVEMESIVKTNREMRLKSQPLEYRNAGSVFKNPDGDYAGRLIEECGLKGYKIGDASVSEKHANFIVNLGNATSKDIKDLIKYIKTTVYKKFHIKLEEEQIIVKW